MNYFHDVFVGIKLRNVTNPFLATWANSAAGTKASNKTFTAVPTCFHAFFTVSLSLGSTLFAKILAKYTATSFFTKLSTMHNVTQGFNFWFSRSFPVLNSIKHLRVYTTIIFYKRDNCDCLSIFKSFQLSIKSLDITDGFVYSLLNRVSNTSDGLLGFIDDIINIHLLGCTI